MNAKKRTYVTFSIFTPNGYEYKTEHVFSRDPSKLNIPKNTMVYCFFDRVGKKGQPDNLFYTWTACGKGVDIDYIRRNYDGDVIKKFTNPEYYSGTECGTSFSEVCVGNMVTYPVFTDIGELHEIYSAPMTDKIRCEKTPISKKDKIFLIFTLIAILALLLLIASLFTTIPLVSSILFTINGTGLILWGLMSNYKRKWKIIMVSAGSIFVLKQVYALLIFEYQTRMYFGDIGEFMPFAQILHFFNLV
jgi:hypothetical protein